MTEIKLNCSYPLKFYVLSDIHWGSKKTNNILKKSFQLLPKIVDNSGTNILFILGDLCETLNKEFFKYMKYLSEAFDWIFLIEGNHDEGINIKNLEILTKEFPNFYLVDNFVNINSKVEIINIEKVSVEELLICDDIKNARVIIFISHFPPFGKLDKTSFFDETTLIIEPKPKHQGKKEILQKLEAIRDTLSTSNNYVLFGHVHSQGGKIGKNEYYKYVNVSPFNSHLCLGYNVYVITIFEDLTTKDGWESPLNFILTEENPLWNKDLEKILNNI
ncbi:MAG: metallophosphoesterase [Candidatus Aenigmatarchaeota archaeon]